MLEIGIAFRKGESAGTRAMFILGGLVSVAFGTVLFARPGVGAITLALLFGLFNLQQRLEAIVGFHQQNPRLGTDAAYADDLAGHPGQGESLY